MMFSWWGGFNQWRIDFVWVEIRIQLDLSPHEAASFPVSRIAQVYLHGDVSATPILRCVLCV